MIHRHHAVAEKHFLYPPVIDVLEALIGPDVLALQTMMFLNPPGMGGQGWHQDAYYIPSLPDTLIGAWMALDRADEENGCLWVIPGSHAEPIYPTPDRRPVLHTEESFDDLEDVENVSILDDSINTLSRVVRKYPDPIPVVCEPGDVIFFHSHLLHRSYRNRTEDRFRRAFVSHYCNARSWVPWNHGQTWEGEAANQMHILARGTTHLPYAEPKFGTPVYTSTGPGGTGRYPGADDGRRWRHDADVRGRSALRESCGPELASVRDRPVREVWNPQDARSSFPQPTPDEASCPGNERRNGHRPLPSRLHLVEPQHAVAGHDTNRAPLASDHASLSRAP